MNKLINTNKMTENIISIVLDSIDPTCCRVSGRSDQWGPEWSGKLTDERRWTRPQRQGKCIWVGSRINGNWAQRISGNKAKGSSGQGQPLREGKQMGVRKPTWIKHRVRRPEGNMVGWGREGPDHRDTWNHTNKHWLGSSEVLCQMQISIYSISCNKS